MRKPQNDNELLTMARHEKASSFTFYDSDSRAQNMREWTEKKWNEVMRMCTQWKGKQWFLSKDKTQHKCIQNTIYVVSSVLYPSALFPTTKHMKHNNGEKNLS